MKVLRLVAWLSLGFLFALGSLRPALFWAQSQQPVLQVSPTSLSFEGQVDGPDPAPQALTLSITGQGVFEWHASADVDWITLGATEGTLSGGRAIQLAVLVDPEGLATGEYQGTITIEAPEAQGSPAIVKVALTLSLPPLPKEFISYSSNRFGSYDCWIMEPDGSNPRQITHLPGGENGCSWSPDGSQLVFTRRIGGDPEHLWIMNADGSSLRQLTHGPGEETDPAWSPDGKKIAFVRIKEDSDGNGEFESWYDDGEIWVLDLETGRERQLTFNTSAQYPERVDWIPTWSPDGSQIAFTSGRSGSSDIWIMDADGLNLRKLPDNEMWIWGPSWSVNNEIAFVAYHRETTKDDIWVMGANGRNLRKVTDLPDWEQLPQWSPDGKNIAFSRSITWGGKRDIWAIEVNGSNLRNLTDSPLSSEYIDDWVLIKGEEE